MRKEIDLKAGTCTLHIPEPLVMVFNGLSADILTRLAMIGAVALVTKRSDPKKAWELVQQGIFGRDTRNRRISLTVRAMGLLGEISEDEARKVWKKLSSKERKQVKSDPQIKALVAQLKSESLADKTGTVTADWLRAKL